MLIDLTKPIRVIQHVDRTEVIEHGEAVTYAFPYPTYSIEVDPKRDVIGGVGEPERLDVKKMEAYRRFFEAAPKMLVLLKTLVCFRDNEAYRPQLVAEARALIAEIEEGRSMKDDREAEHYSLADWNEMRRTAMRMEAQQLQCYAMAALHYLETMRLPEREPVDPEFFEKNAAMLRGLNGTIARHYKLELAYNLSEPITARPAMRCLQCDFLTTDEDAIKTHYCPQCRMYLDYGDRPGRQREIVELIEARNFEPIKGRRLLAEASPALVPSNIDDPEIYDGDSSIMFSAATDNSKEKL